MPHEIRIPSVGESITTATIAQWHKEDGDAVTSGDPLLTFDTDKVSTDLQAERSGILHIVVPVGQEVPIGTVVASIEEFAQSQVQPAPTPPAVPMQQGTIGEATGSDRKPVEEEPVKVTPVARKIAEEKGVALQELEGTGAGGRITKADVIAAVEAPKPAAPAPAPELSVVVPETTVSPAPSATPKTDRTTRRKMSPLRRKIASQLVTAQQQAALLTTFNECDMSAVMELRQRVQESFVAKHGVKLGFMSFFVKAVVEALKAVPQVNARIDGEDIVENHYHDIGVAVGTEKGLVVPVLRDCDTKTFADIEKDIAGYAQKAREGRIQLEDLQGGVFTISNGGIYGSLLSTPIVNPPQSGILGMHTIQQRPVAVNGQVVIRPMMYLALTYDHRLVDGKEAVTFLLRIKDCVEDPARLLVGA
jgi:2-oxoglutarate dehydrogenase E2 component (dihydrolipoamide succinyltransferase)